MAWRGTTIALPGQLSCIPGRGGEGARTHTFRASPLRTIDWRRYRYQRPLGPGAVDTSRWTRVQGVADGGMAGGPRGKAEEARYVLVLSTDYLLAQANCVQIIPESIQGNPCPGSKPGESIHPRSEIALSAVTR